MAVRSLDDARDRDLMRRVRTGDEEAFRLLFHRYGPLGKGLATRIVRQPFMAEEIVQEAFLSLWRNPDAYREERGSVRSWLMSTVHHRAVDAVRREESQRRRAEDPAGAERGVERDVGDQVVDDLYLEEARGRVRQALEALPAEQREVLELMYFEGKSQSAIAEARSLPLGTVKSRTLLGMRRMRAYLGSGER